MLKIRPDSQVLLMINKTFTSSSQETRAVHSAAGHIISVEQRRRHEHKEYHSQCRVAPQ